MKRKCLAFYYKWMSYYHMKRKCPKKYNHYLFKLIGMIPKRIEKND